MEGYQLSPTEIAKWTLDQLYLAVVDKNKLPKQRQKPGTMTVSYEEALAMGLFDKDKSGDGIDHRAAAITAAQRSAAGRAGPAAKPQLPSCPAPQPESPEPKRRRRGR